MMLRRKKILLLLILISVFVSSFSNVFALEYGGIGGKPAFPDPNNSRTESIYIFTLEPKASKKDGLLVVNNTRDKKTLLLYATDSQRSSDGSFACAQLADEKKGVGNWISLEKSEVTLNAGTNTVVDFTITAPENPEVGEQNGCILIQEKTSSSSQGGVSLSFRTGVRVAVTIPGEQIRVLSLEKVDTTVKDNKIKSTVYVKSSGNVSIDTSVNITTESIFGAKTQVVDNQYPILRGELSTYNFDIPIDETGGFYRVISTISYDESASASIGINSPNPKKLISTSSDYVFIVPTINYLVMYIILIVTILILGGIFVKRLLFFQSVKKTWEKIPVTEDDNIQTIAQKYSISWKKIAQINKIKEPYTLKNGMSLLVPPRIRNTEKILKRSA